MVGLRSLAPNGVLFIIPYDDCIGVIVGGTEILFTNIPYGTSAFLVGGYGFSGGETGLLLEGIMLGVIKSVYLSSSAGALFYERNKKSYL